MKEQSCFNCKNNNIVDLTHGRYKIDCKLGISVLNECIGGIKDNYIGKKSDREMRNEIIDLIMEDK